MGTKLEDYYQTATGKQPYDWQTQLADHDRLLRAADCRASQINPPTGKS